MKGHPPMQVYRGWWFPRLQYGAAAVDVIGCRRRQQPFPHKWTPDMQVDLAFWGGGQFLKSVIFPSAISSSTQLFQAAQEEYVKVKWNQAATTSVEKMEVCRWDRALSKKWVALEKAPSVITGWNQTRYVSLDDDGPLGKVPMESRFWRGDSNEQ